MAWPLLVARRVSVDRLASCVSDLTRGGSGLVAGACPAPGGKIFRRVGYLVGYGCHCRQRVDAGSFGPGIGNLIWLWLWLIAI